MDEIKQLVLSHTKILEDIQNDKQVMSNKLINLQELLNKLDIQLDTQLSNYTNPIENNTKIIKPFLKWLGGKTQIINIILRKTPLKINNYHELFVGGGSVLLGNLSLLKNKQIEITGQIYAYDINKGLINVYQQIKNNKDTLYNLIHAYINQYDSCPIIKKSEVNRNPQNIEEALKSKENYYYWLRKKFNNTEKTSVEHASLFIVINKTTFRGMYRDGPNGFNVPYGNYKTTPVMMTKEYINEVSSLLQNVIFTCCDFKEAIKNIKPDDYVYLDPPYAPENKNSFVSYDKNGFDIDDHNNLFTLIKNQKNIKFCMSNSNVKLVLDNFKDYNIKKIICKRSINSKKPQSTTSELVITNFKN